MPFPWYESAVPPEVRGTFRAKRERMYVEEAKRRAQILRSLGYDRAYARARVRGNLLWDFELHGPVTWLNRVDEAVDQVYMR